MFCKILGKGAKDVLQMLNPMATYYNKTQNKIRPKISHSSGPSWSRKPRRRLWNRSSSILGCFNKVGRASGTATCAPLFGKCFMHSKQKKTPVGGDGRVKKQKHTKSLGMFPFERILMAIFKAESNFLRIPWTKRPILEALPGNQITTFGGFSTGQAVTASRFCCTGVLH